ncbi:CCR4-Not complex component, Not1-domain-containing protein [Pilobolus umbonatus]|nr:CCR4-Not complex component, Not1-domain-containing protein [Pilobolus umbonatus]
MTQNKDPDQTDGLISKMILEAGYECCSSVSSVQELLGDIPINENEVAETLGCMARTYINMTGVGNGSSQSESKWNVENFVTAINERAPNLDWDAVIRYLDYEHFFLYDAKGLEILIRAWKHSPGGKTKNFPANHFFGKWKNLKGQLSALYQLTNVSTDILSLVSCSQKTVITADDFIQSSPHIRAMVSQLLNDQLNSLDLIECVIRLADTTVADDVKVFLEMMVNKVPELIFLGLLQVEPISNSVHEDLLARLIIFYLTGNASSVLVMTKFWKIKPELFTKNIIELYSKDQTSLTRILAFVHELKILPKILDLQPFLFTIDLAALATRREYLNLEKWLQDKIMEHGDVFAQTCLKFLSRKVRAELARQDANSSPITVPLSIDVVNVFIKVLSESNLMRPEKDLLRDIHSTYLQLSQKNATAEQPEQFSNAVVPSSSGEITFRQDIEDEANSYYERIYSGEISIDEMIDRLRKFSTSKDPREQDVFACMIHNLFDEYNFFPKYPDKELAITSILFGSLIQNQLISYAPLGIALKCVLDALGNVPGNKMYNFGLQALAQFQSRLPEWPQYCTHLLQVPSLQQANPDLINLIKSSIQIGRLQHQQQGLVPDMSNSVVAKSDENQLISSNIVFTAICIPDMLTVEDITYEPPTEGVQDKILFIMNNVALNNLQSKSANLKDQLSPSAYQWFSNYLVVKRASIEPNYHDLYILLLKSVGNDLLYQHVLRETFVNIKILLNSENTVSSSTERTLLKNLGSWLGGMTLAQNKPIKQKYVSFKDLLLEGYDTNRLIVIIPFVCKVLEQGTKNTVFIPPNPWVMAILKLLVELYENADLKLNLKFEIEVLCKSLSIELNTIKPTTVLKNRPLKNQVYVPSVSPPITNSAPPEISPFAVNGVRSALNNLISPSTQENNGLSAADNAEDLSINIPNLAPYITFNPQIVLYSSQPNSKRWVLQAITQSIREIIGPVVERSVAIASVSTRELVAKDFAMESDENKMRKSAHLMAQSLAGSLAMVTCKDPLRASMMNHIRTLFISNGLGETVAEQAALLTVADNLDLVCAVIEKIAMEKVILEVDEVLLPAYTNRKKHREQRLGNQPYFDMEIFGMSRYPATLPEPLRPKPNSLQPAQLRVYEDFTRIPRLASQVSTPAGQMVEPERAFRSGMNVRPEVRPDVRNGNYNNGVASSFEGNQQVTAHQMLERFTQYITELEKLVSVTNVPHFSSLPVQHDIIHILRQIPLLAMSSFDKSEAARTFAQKVVQLLYKSETQLGREMYVILLERLCEISPNVGVLVTSWLTHADDERKYNVPVTVALIKANLINLPEQDQELANLIDSGRLSAVDFTARLIRACLFDENPLASRQEFIASLEALSRLRGNIPKSVLILMDEIRRRASTPISQPQPQSQFMRSETVKDEELGLRDHVQYLFTEWVRLYQHPNSSDKILNAFVAQLSQQNILKKEDTSSFFYRASIEISIEHAIKFKQLPGQSASLAYQPIDAFSKLIVGLLKLPVATQENQDVARLTLLTKVLSIIVLIISQHHEQRQPQFNQKPFLRLFTSLLTDLHSSEMHIQSIYIPILTALSNTFNTLQPSQFPGFTFAWLQLISHRLFMPKLLLADNQKGWPVFQRLLVCLFKFLGPFLQNAQLKDTTRMLYRGTLRVLLVLLHDFPEFLCDYHYSLCDVIPSSCIQLRNLILSAFPRHMRLPDPFTPNLKVDLLPEINQSPKILSDYTAVLKTNNLKYDIDEYLQNRSYDSFLPSLIPKLLSNKAQLEEGNKYNVPMINALVFYIGTIGINESIPVNQGSPVEIFQYLLNELDSEGRYLFLSAIANQLRYPNSHTHYFSCVILYLFAENNKEIVKEQITRVLLERLIVNRPHPWGLLITFIELIKNPRYSFWNHSFTRCATDIERLFESVSRSINQI